MAHPHRNDAKASHTAKLKAMTTHYGSASGPKNNILAPSNKDKGEGGQTETGFGADSSRPKARADRASRSPRVTAANPIATYARGGRVRKRADGGGTISDGLNKAGLYTPGQKAAQQQMQSQQNQMASGSMASSLNDSLGNVKDKLPNRKHGGKVKRADGGSLDVSSIEEANRDQASTQNRAKGGRTGHKKGATHVNVIVAPQGGAGAGGPPMMPPRPPMPVPMAGPPPGAPPGMPPGAMAGARPPMAGLPMAPGAPGGIPPGIMPPRAKGGRVNHPDEAQDKALIKKTLREEGLTRDDGPPKPGVGGSRGKVAHHHMTAGGASGPGRLEKIGEKPKAVSRASHV